MKDTGEVLVIANFTGDSANYNLIPDKTATLKINQKPITITIDDKESIYGDQFLPLTSQIPSGAVVGADDLGITLAKGTGKIVGDYSITGTWTNQNYQVNFENGNYKITPRDAVVQWTKNDTYVYNGQNQLSTITAKFSGIAEDSDISLTVWISSGESEFKNAKGQGYDFIASTQNGNYTLLGVVMEKAVVTQPILVDDRIYSGANQLANLTANPLYTISGEGKDVGSHQSTVTFVGSSNYKWEGKDPAVESDPLTFTWQIAQAQNQWTTPPAIVNFVYGDTQNMPTLSSKFGEATVVHLWRDSSLSDDAWHDYSQGTFPKNAGTYTIKSTVPETANYKLLTGEAVLTISPKDLKETMLTNSVSFENIVYDGSEKKIVPTLSDISKITTNDFTVSYSNADLTNAKTVTVTVTGQNNYGSAFSFDYVIGKKAVEISPARLDITYGDQLILAYTMSGENLETLHFTYETNAPLSTSGNETSGTHSITAVTLTRVTGGNAKTENYTLTLAAASGNNKITVGKKLLTNLQFSREYVFDSVAFSETLNGAHGIIGKDQVILTFDVESDTLGEKTPENIVFSGADKDNYDMVNISLTAEIVEKLLPQIQFTEEPNFIYSGNSQIPNVEIEGAEEGVHFTLTFSSAGETIEFPTNAGTYTVSATSVVDSGFSGTVTKNYVISKKDITATALSAEKKYGDENPEFVVETTGLADVDSHIVFAATTNAQTDSLLGKYPIVITRQNLPNYNVSYQENNVLLEIKGVVTVLSGDSGEEEEFLYSLSQTVAVSASNIDGQTFDNWTSDFEGLVFTGEKDSETTFEMPNKSVVVTANYRFETPNLPIDYFNEKLTNLEVDSKYKVIAEGKEFFVEGSEALDISDSWHGKEIALSKQGDTVNEKTVLSSENFKVMIPIRYGRPAPATVQITSVEGKGTIELDQTMEFRLSGETEWTVAPENNLIENIDPSQKNVIYEVRTKAVDQTRFASVLTTVTIVKPTTVKVSIVGGKSGGEANLERMSNETLEISVTSKEGYVFDYWTSSGGGKFENARNASTTFLVPNKNVVVTANFKKEVQDKPLTGQILGSDGKPEAGVTVILKDKDGDAKDKTTVTDANGNFVFDQVPDGNHTLVVEKEDETGNKQEITTGITSDGNKKPQITLPEGSVVTKIKDNDDAVAQEQRNPTTVENLENQTTKEETLASELVEISFTKTDVTTSQTPDVELAKLKIEAMLGERTLSKVFDYSYEKTIKKPDQTEEKYTQPDKILKIIQDVPSEMIGKHVFVIRVHGGIASEMKLNVPDENGEYYEIYDTYAVIYTKSFSEYAFAYLDEPAPRKPVTGDTEISFTPSSNFWKKVDIGLRLKATNPVYADLTNENFETVPKYILTNHQLTDKTLTLKFSQGEIVITSEMAEKVVYENDYYTFDMLQNLFKEKPTPSPTPVPQPPESTTDHNSPNLWWLWLLIALLAVGTITAYVVKKKKNH